VLAAGRHVRWFGLAGCAGTAGGGGIARRYGGEHGRGGEGGGRFFSGIATGRGLLGRKFRRTGRASACLRRWWDKSSQRVRGLIDEAVAANAPAGTNTRKVADLYKSFMDEAGIEAKGMAPLEPHLKEIAEIKDKKSLAFSLGKTLRADVDALNKHQFSHRESVRACGWRRASTIRSTTRRT